MSCHCIYQQMTRLPILLKNSSWKNYAIQIVQERLNSTADAKRKTEVEGTHIPVMKQEVLDILKPRNGKVFLDMTFGAGGHSRAILEKAPGALVFGLDRDPVAQAEAQKLSKIFPQFIPLAGKFSEAHKLLMKYNMGENSIDGIIFDVGASSMQFDNADRGFSLSRDGPLDMRMGGNSDPEQISAADVVNFMDEESLIKILKRYGEEKKARLIARAILDTRYTFGKIQTTKQLANVVAGVYQIDYVLDKLNRRAHVATKTFQALRIFVNNELNELNNGLEIANVLLKPGGCCVALSFHSLEDRIIKRHFHSINMDEDFSLSIGQMARNQIKSFNKDELKTVLTRRWQPLSKKVTLSSDDEILNNPRSRSAKLRAAVKIFA